MADLFTEFRKRHPSFADRDDASLYNSLIEPAKFRRAFPARQGKSDAEILRFVQKFAPKGFDERHPIGAKALDIATGSAVKAITGKTFGEMAQPAIQAAQKFFDRPPVSYVAPETPLGPPSPTEELLNTRQFTKQAIKTVGQAGTGVADFLATPLGMAQGVTAAAAPALAPAIFGIPMLSEFLTQQAPEIVEGLSEGNLKLYSEELGPYAFLGEVTPEQSESAGLSLGFLTMMGGGAAIGYTPKGIAELGKWRQYYRSEGQSALAAERLSAWDVAKGRKAPESPISIGEPSPTTLALPPASAEIAQFKPDIVRQLREPPKQLGPGLTQRQATQETRPDHRPLKGLSDIYRVSDVPRVELQRTTLPRAKEYVQGLQDYIAGKRGSATNLDSAGNKITEGTPFRFAGKKFNDLPEATQQILRQELDRSTSQVRMFEEGEKFIEIASQQSKGLPPNVDLTFGAGDFNKMGDLGLTREALGSPSIQFGRISPSAGRIVEETSRHSNRIAAAVDHQRREMWHRWGPMSVQERNVTSRLLNDPAVTPENIGSQPNVSPKMIEAYTHGRDYLTNSLVRINKARIEAGEAPLAGRAGYWMHIFPGTWMIGRRVQGAWKVEPKTPRPGAAPHIYETHTSALEALGQLQKQGRATDLYVVPKRLFISRDAAITANQLGRTMSNTALSVDPTTGMPIEIAIPSAAKPGRMRAERLMPRKANFGGWLEGPRAVEMYINQVERYIEMTPFRREVRGLKQQVAKEAPLETHPHLHAALERYIDSAIVGKPHEFSARASEGWAMWMGQLKQSKLPGVRHIANMEPLSASKAARVAMLTEAALKLGLSPAAALANFSQPFTHTVPRYGVQPTIKIMWEAIRHPKKFNAKYADLFDHLGLPGSITKTEASATGFRGHFLPRTVGEAAGMSGEGIAASSLYAFRMSEGWNRQITAAVAFESVAKFKPPKTPEILNLARQEAQRGVMRTQFQYGVADASRLFRPSFMKAPLQFRTFSLKTLEMITGLKVKDGSLPRFMLVSLPIMGARGTVVYGPAVALTAFVWSQYTGREITPEEINLMTRNAHPAIQFAFSGLPGVMGLETTQTIGLGDIATPYRQPKDLLGPAGKDLYNLARAAPGYVAKFGPQILGQPQGVPTRTQARAMADFEASAGVSMRRAQVSFGSPESLTDPRSGRPLLRDPSQYERFSQLGGFMPRRLANLYDLMNVERKTGLSYQDRRSGYVDRLASLVQEAEAAKISGDSQQAEGLSEEIRRVEQEAIEKGFGKDLAQSVRQRAKENLLTREESMRKRSPIPVRTKLQELFEKYGQ